jgi:hypothetical protein
MTANIEPITANMTDASRMSGLSRSELYRRLTDGSIHAVKNGGRTLVMVASLRAYLDALPAATFGAARRSATAAEAAAA